MKYLYTLATTTAIIGLTTYLFFQDKVTELFKETTEERCKEKHENYTLVPPNSDASSDTEENSIQFEYEAKDKNEEE
jgi:hypothetical protein